MNETERIFVPTSSYTYSMIVGLTLIAVCFVCSFCFVFLRTMFEREKRRKRATNFQRFIINLPELDPNDWQRTNFNEKNLPVAYGQMMTMLGKSIKEIDEFKDQLENLPKTIAQKLSQVKGNANLEHFQRALVQNQIHF